MVLKVAALATGLIAVVAVSILAAALLLQDDEQGTQSPEAAGLTRDEALHGLIDSLLHADATTLAAQFGDVGAREGQIIGGPIGLYQPRSVDAAEWTSRLAAAGRRLHGVVADPVEPFAWTQPTVLNQPPLPPRAAIFAPTRDYDVVLVVGTDTEARPWRFSILDGHVIDVVIDGEGLAAGDRAPGIRSLVQSLAQLTPSPEHEPGSFLVLPPEKDWLPPYPQYTGVAPSPAAAGVVPSFAPDGRTGNAELDAIIDALVRDDAAKLAKAFTIAGREEVCAQPTPGGCSIDQVRLPLADWTKRLASSKRALFAVVTDDPADASVYLAVDEGHGRASPWVFGVDNGRLVELSVRWTTTDPLPAGAAKPDYLSMVAGYAPSPAREYDRFYVLPPRDQLPQAPASHSVSVRSGDANVDALLARVEAKDVAGLIALLEAPGQVFFRQYLGRDESKDAAAATSLLQEVLPRIAGVHAVVRLPAGYQPVADHLIILIDQTGHYRWQALGILEHGGRIAGFVTGECQAEYLYPPSSYVLPPPVPGVTAPRLSGIPAVDAILTAARSNDTAAMAKLIVYSPVPCGYEYSPPCPAGGSPGTPVEAISISTCHGGYSLPDQAPRDLVEIARASLYAVIKPEPSAMPPPRDPMDASAMTVLLVGEQGQPVAMTVTDSGVSDVRRGCGIFSPEWLSYGTNTPVFLLPPP